MAQATEKFTETETRANQAKKLNELSELVATLLAGQTAQAATNTDFEDRIGVLENA